MTKQELPTRQARIAAVVVHLASLKPGDAVTHAHLRDHLGLNVHDQQDYGVFYAALQRATKEHGIVLRSERGVGYVRLSDEEIAKDSSRMGKIRRQAKRSLDETFAANGANLSPEGQCTAAVKAVLLTDIVRRTGQRAIRKEVEITMSSSSGVAELFSALKDARAVRPANDGKTRKIATGSSSGAQELLLAFGAGAKDPA